MPMDERKNNIKDLEGKKHADIEARNRLLECLGEALLQRIGEGEPFTENSGDTPGALLAEYRVLQKEIAESADMIKSLEKEILQLKELEEAISAKEAEKSRLEEELGEAHSRLGKALLEDPDFHDASGLSRRQEESLLAKIDEQEVKLEELEEREGGIFTWLGKNAQIAVSKALLSKNRFALQRVYRSIGEKFSSSVHALDGESAEAAGKAMEQREFLSSLNADLAELKGERRKIGDSFGSDGNPSRRIQGLEKRIANVKGQFPGVYLRFGSLATESSGREALASFNREEDGPILEQAEIFASSIAERELEIKKIKAAMKIDDEKAEIEKMKKAISSQQHKISAAEEAIAGLEKHIAETELSIEEMKAFIQEDHGSQN